MLFKDATSYCQINAPIIVCEENSMKHISHNIDKDDVFKYHVDGDIIKDNTTVKCDFLVENETKKNAYLIELKGTDLSHALEQIEKTKCIFSDLFKTKSYNVHLRIVYRSNTHAVRSTQYRRFKEKYGSYLKVGTNILEDNI